VSRRRQRQIGKRLVELYLGERTAAATAEVAELRAELDAMRPVEPSPPELPPGNGSFTMRRARPLTEEEAEKQRWRKVVAMRQGSPMQRTLYNPDKGIGVPVDRSKEHVTGLIPRSAMRSGSLPRRFEQGR
jgi:hypothetical protein